MWGMPQRPSLGGGGAYWGQWDSHYGPIQRRVASRRHQAAAMFGPLAGYRLPMRPAAPQPQMLKAPLALSPAVAKPVIEKTAATHTASLYYDFNTPSKPNVLSVRCAVQSIQAELTWNAPRVNKDANFVYKIKVSGDSKGESQLEYPSWKTNAVVALEPGNWYKILVEAVSNNKVIASGEVSFKSILCSAEMALLQTKGVNFLQTVHGVNQMQEVMIFYRNKPPDYWHKIQAFDGVMRPYLKDQCGNPGSPINGEINGLFFAARLHNGMLPTSSPFGGQRLKLLCPKLFLPETHNMYFGDFYCNTYVHYVTVVICIKNSPVDAFCRDKLDMLDPFDNLFLRLTVDDYGNYRYFINNNVWVEVYYTGDVPLWWGEFDYTISMGQSKPNGIPNNKFCKLCNLYPLEPPPALSPQPDKTKTVAAAAEKRVREPSAADSPRQAAAEPDAKRPRHDWSWLQLPVQPLAAEPSSTLHVVVDVIRAAAADCEDDVEHEETLAVVAETLLAVVDSVVGADGDADAPAAQQAVARNTVQVAVPPANAAGGKRLSEADEQTFVDSILRRFGDDCYDNFDGVTRFHSDHVQSSPARRGVATAATIDHLRVAHVEVEARSKKLTERLMQIKVFMKNLEKKLACYI